MSFLINLSRDLDCSTVEWLDRTADALVSSDLLETELRRIAERERQKAAPVAPIAMQYAV